MTLNIFEEDYASPDALVVYLEGLGYEGSVNDMMFKYLVDQGYFGSLADMISQAPATPDGFTVTLTGLTSSIAVVGDHASISYTISPDNGTETVAWGTSAGDSTFGTGSSPTDFTASDGGTLWCSVTDGGNTVYESAPIRYAAAVNTVAPSITSAGISLGDTQTIDVGTWTAAGGSYTYQWLRDGVAISGATSSTYDIVVADDNAALTCDVTYTNSGGSTTAGSSNSTFVDDFFAPIISSVPTISGTEQVGQTLTATGSSVTGNPGPVKTWQWKRSGVSIAGAASSTYTLVSADEGETITVLQTETNPVGVSSAESTATGTIAAGATDTTDPSVTSSSYTDATQSLNITVVEDNPSTCYWALVANPSTPTEAQVVAGSGGGILEAGSFSYTAGSSTPSITVTDETGDELHLVFTDVAGNTTGTPSGVNNTIVTGITVDSTAPTFSSGTPADDSTGAGLTVDPVVTFNENIVGVATKTFTVYDVTNTAVEETFTWTNTTTGTGSNGGSCSASGTDVTLVMGADLTASTAYSVRWEAGAVKDIYGNQVAANTGDTLYNFTTGTGSVTLTEVTFNGTTSSFNTNGTALGPTSATQFSGCVIGLNTTAAQSGYVFTSGDIRTYVRYVSNGDLYIRATNSAGTEVFRWFNDASFDYNFKSGNEFDVCWSYNSTSGTAYVYVRVNGGSWTSAGGSITTNLSSETIDFDNTNWGFGYRATGADYFSGSLYGIRIWDSYSPDLSTTSNCDDMIAGTQATGVTPLVDLGFATVGEWNTTNINLGDYAGTIDVVNNVT